MINIVLFEPEIPGNTGNIMRTCVATNSHLHLIKPLGFSLDEKYIKRSGVNYIDKCVYTVYENIDEFFEKKKEYEERMGKQDTSKNYYFIFGKESTGIPPHILKPYIDRCMRMPMTDNVRALNLSNTVAIMTYEALRQQGYPGLLFDEPHKSKNFIEES